jgi:hypothetical protein
VTSRIQDNCPEELSSLSGFLEELSERIEPGVPWDAEDRMEDCLSGEIDTQSIECPGGMWFPGGDRDQN